MALINQTLGGIRQAVTVYLSDGVTLASLFSDEALTVPVAQPGFSTRQNGLIVAYAAPGAYKAVADDGSVLVFTIADPVAESGGGGGDSVEARDAAIAAAIAAAPHPGTFGELVTFVSTKVADAPTFPDWGHHIDNSQDDPVDIGTTPVPAIEGPAVQIGTVLWTVSGLTALKYDIGGGIFHEPVGPKNADGYFPYCLNYITRFDLASKTWLESIPLPATTQSPGGISMEGGFVEHIDGVLYFGGGDGSELYGELDGDGRTGTELQLWKYDIGAGTFARLADIPGFEDGEYFDYDCSAVGDGLLYLCCGSNFRRYTPLTDSWEDLGPILSGGSTPDIGYGYTQVGYDMGHGYQIGRKLFFVEYNASYDIDTSTWALIVDIPSPGHNWSTNDHLGFPFDPGCPTAFADGVIIALCGEDNPGGNVNAGLWTFDGETFTFQPGHVERGPHLSKEYALGVHDGKYYTQSGTDNGQYYTPRGTPAGMYESVPGNPGALSMVADSLVAGLGNTAGFGAMAVGTGNTASYFGATAMGGGTTASGYADHAEGSATVASGGPSHAEGLYSKALAQGSHAEGYNTRAEGLSSHARGYITLAAGYASTASGWSSKARVGASEALAAGNFDGDDRWGQAQVVRSVGSVKTEGNQTMHIGGMGGGQLPIILMDPRSIMAVKVVVVAYDKDSGKAATWDITALAKCAPDSTLTLVNPAITKTAGDAGTDGWAPTILGGDMWYYGGNNEWYGRHVKIMANVSSGEAEVRWTAYAETTEVGFYVEYP